MSPARARTRTARSGEKYADYKFLKHCDSLVWRGFLGPVIRRVFLAVSHDVLLFILVYNSLFVNPANEP